MAEFVLAPVVEDELWEIWGYIARDNPDAAARVIDAAYDNFKLLAARPALGRLRKFHNPRLKGVRSRVLSGFDNYVIFYRPMPDGIQVLHIYHGARDIEALFDKQ